MISYRGKMKDLRQLETFEDRIIELAVEFGGYARIWRTSSEANPQRVLRGVLLDLAPGLETISLLISPEGCLVPIALIKQAEQAPLDGPPWLKVNTAFASLEAHTMLAELLATLRDIFFPEMEINAGVSSTRAGGEPIERLAERVRRTITRPPEHPPVQFADSEDDDLDCQRYGTEQEWDAFYKENERKQAGLMRAFEECNLQGGDPGESFEAALRSEGIVDLPEFEEGDGAFNEAQDTDLDAADEDAKWSGSLEDGDSGADDDDDGEESDDGEQDDEESLKSFVREKHPLMKRMTKLTMKVMKLPKGRECGPGGFFDPLIKGIFEMSGGLAQVFSSPEDNDTPFGLVLVQLKRAQRGAAFAHGALQPAREMGYVTDADFKHIQSEVAAIESEISSKLESTRRRLHGK